MFGREKLNALLGDSDTTLADIMPTLETQWHNNPRNQTHTHPTLQEIHSLLEGILIYLLLD